MITIKDYKSRINSDNEEFFALILEGDLEVVKSENGGIYFTSRTTSIPSTFDEKRCQQLIGKQLPGRIVKKSCDPYEYTLPETGEVIILNFTYEYETEPVSMEEAVFSNEEELVP